VIYDSLVAYDSGPGDRIALDFQDSLPTAVDGKDPTSVILSTDCPPTCGGPIGPVTGPFDIGSVNLLTIPCNAQFRPRRKNRHPKIRTPATLPTTMPAIAPPPSPPLF
jgi:hypothetical protein